MATGMIVLQGADCSSLSCSNCTSSPLCGWCSAEASFSDAHSVSDWKVFQRLESHGRCIGRGAGGAPWCASCPLTYALGADSCPVYTGADPSAGGGGGSGEHTAHGHDGGATASRVRIVIGVLVALAMFASCGGMLLYWRRRQTARSSSGHVHARAVELNDAADGSASPRQLHRPLNDGGFDSEAGYVPPSSSLNHEARYAPVVASVPDL